MKLNTRERAVIYDYENLLIGKSQKFSDSTFGDCEGIENKRKTAGLIWRYAITEYLGWTAQEAVLYMTADIAKKLLLDRVYKNIELDPNKVLFRDYRFILQYAFPKEVKYDIKEEAIEAYNKHCKLGKWRNNKEYYRYPKKFFMEEDGEIRANELLNYVVNLYMGDRTNEELYDFFSQKGRAKSWLVEKELGDALEDVYGDDPLEYYHMAINPGRKDDMYYYAAKVRREIVQKINADDYD